MKHIKLWKLSMLAVMVSILLMMYPSVSAEEAQTVAYAVTGGNIYFNPATGTVTGCDNTVTTAVIPARIQGVNVTTIGQLAFDSKDNLTKVVLPEGIKTIEFRAFAYNNKLTSLNLPASITKIASGAFNVTTSLHSVGPVGGGYDIEYGWQQAIPEDAFESATGVNSVVIADGITTLGESCFEYTAITQLDLPDSVTTIEAYAFESCSRLESVNFSKNLTSIGVSAFEGCTSLQSLSLPYGIQTLGERAFGKCEKLNSVYIPASVRSIGKMAFWRCYNLKQFSVDSGNSVFKAIDGVLFSDNGKYLHSYPTGGTGSYTVPSGVTMIGDSAFEDCENITSIQIPYGVTNIDIWAFYNCTALKTVSLPGSVTSIGNNGFRNCTALEKVYYYGTPEQWSATSFGFHNEPIKNAPIEYINHKVNVTGGANGTASASVTVAVEGQPVTLSATPNSGYRFKQWNVTSGNVTITNNTFTMGNSDVYIEAVFEQDALLVTFNPNGGTVNPTSKTVYNGEVFGDLPIPVYAKHLFQGWFTTATAGTLITSGTTVNLSRNTTLYAHWAPVPSNTLHYDANGGSGAPSNQTCSSGETLTIPATVPTRFGYDFQGWGTSSGSSSASYYPGGTILMTADTTLYAVWKPKPIYTITYNANGGTGTPSSQTKEGNVTLTLSSLTPSKRYVIQYNANGGSVSPASKSVSCTFNNWNTALNGSGTSYVPGGTYTANASVTLYAQWTNPAAGTLATPSRSGYKFDGWFTSATGGTQIKGTSTVTGNMTIYARWTKSTNIYNMGEETYSFENYGDSDSPGGHCFGMSMTSAGYYIGRLDISKIGGGINKPLYSLDRSATVKAPICYYQGAQEFSASATVAGGSYYLHRYNDISSDWQEVVNYVRNHSYDNTGLLQIGFRGKYWYYSTVATGGHAINFLRYENVNGQDRIYAYDNNYPTQETYFYCDSSGKVHQEPVQNFNISIDCIALRDCRTYFKLAPKHDSSHALYMPKDSAVVQGYSYVNMDGPLSGEEYVMYIIPSDQDRVIIVPNRDYADFIYMDTEYSFGEIADDTYGELRFATLEEGAVVADGTFRILSGDTVLGKPDFTLPAALTKIEAYAFEGIAATTVYVLDTCTSIGSYAFRNSAVKKIRIPAGCTIASTAFDGCENVRIFGKAGSKAESFCNAHDNCTFVAE